MLIAHVEDPVSGKGINPKSISGRTELCNQAVLYLGTRLGSW